MYPKSQRTLSELKIQQKPGRIGDRVMKGSTIWVEPD